MKTWLLAFALLFASHEASATTCKQKHSSDNSYVELAVPDGAPRPASVEEFKFITDDTTFDELVAKVGPPHASYGSRTSYLIWCFADGSEVTVATKDRVAIENVRHDGKQIFKRTRKK